MSYTVIDPNQPVGLTRQVVDPNAEAAWRHDESGANVVVPMPNPHDSWAQSGHDWPRGDDDNYSCWQDSHSVSGGEVTMRDGRAAAVNPTAELSMS